MACFKPIQGRRGGDGVVRFDEAAVPGFDQVVVTCGRCVGCRVERSRQWAVRMMHEAQMHEQNCFLTLTYSDSNLPEDGSLKVKHWQDFAKRLRKRLDKDGLGGFRFFHCGEYGEDDEATKRPHYHACIFGQDFRGDRKFYKRVRGNALWTSKLVEDEWGMGFAPFGNLSFESAAYVARYCLKKVTGEKAVEHYGGRSPEYSTMSRRPGLGAAWMERYGGEVYPDDFVVSRGMKARPPKYYDLFLEKRDPEMLEEMKERRAEKAVDFEFDNQPFRLKAREAVLRAKMELYKREGA